MSELTNFGALLKEQGATYARFARQFVSVARELNVNADAPQRRQFDRWRIAGRVKTTPRDDATQILERMFPGYSVRELLQPADQRPPLHKEKVAVEADEVLKRRTLLGVVGAGLGLGPAALEIMASTRARLDAAIESSSYSTATLERWEEIANEYARAYQTLPPQELLADLLADIDEVQQMLEAHQPIRHRRRLCRVVAQLAALAGIFTSALGAHREARNWFYTGKLAASEAGDAHLEGTLAVRSAIVSLYYGTPAAAYTHAARARERLRSAVGPASARSLVVEARALARMRRGDEALPLLRQAEDMFGKLSSQDREDIALGYTERQFLFHLGNAWTHLGRTEEAWTVQRRALAQYAPTERLDPALIRIDRATALARAGEPEEAYRIAGGAITSLPTEHRTGMVMRYASDFAAVVGRSELPAGRQFTELLHA
ncbi:hypothetical protein ACFYXL_02915 [Streptomyces tsukubensis]|uniref:hypothetical protein n=1 Tax=Streptomyces tsukubensis TaxID=83656 RepID=UPI0036B55945